MSLRGWFPDPSGRFSQRWYDGHRWTDQVVAANGTTIEDRLPNTATPHPPPMLTQAVPPQAVPGPAAQFALPPPRPAPAFAPAPAPIRTGGGRLMPGATLAVAVLGLLLVTLSLIGVPWSTEGPGFNFLDLNEAARNADAGDEPVVWAYGLAGGFVLLVGAIFGVAVAGIPLPQAPGAVALWRIVVSAGSAVAVVLHMVTVVRIFRGPATPGVGAWLGVVGYFVIILAMVIGHYRRRA